MQIKVKTHLRKSYPNLDLFHFLDVFSAIALLERSRRLLRAHI
jgi:hypothetical protein